MNHPRSLLRRAAGAAAALVVASAALLSAGSSPARADQNTDIKFGPVTLTHVTDKGEAIPAPGRQLYKGDWFYLNVDFDATKANPKPGQSFTIDLPEPFVNRDGGNSRGDVIKPLGYTDSKGATVKAGECKVDRSRITCTFGDAIEGKLDVVGKIQAQLLAPGTTDKTSSVLTINGKEYTVAHPWNEDITLRPAVQFKPSTRLTKGAKGVGTNSTWINWRVLLGGSWLKANYPNGGPVTATDVIQDGLEVPDPATIKLVEVQAGPDGTGETERVVATADGKVKKDGYGIQASFEGKTVTFKVTGSLSTDKNYRIDFDTRFTGGGRIVPGHEYRNQAHLVEANPLLLRVVQCHHLLPSGLRRLPGDQGQRGQRSPPGWAEVRRHRRLQAAERQDRRGLPRLGRARQPSQDDGHRRPDHPVGNLPRGHRDHPHRGRRHRQPGRHRHHLGGPEVLLRGQPGHHWRGLQDRDLHRRRPDHPARPADQQRHQDNR